MVLLGRRLCGSSVMPAFAMSRAIVGSNELVYVYVMSVMPRLKQNGRMGSNSLFNIVITI